MDDQAWSDAVRSVEEAAATIRVLARCLDVAPQLESWRNTRDQSSGNDAADALDQAVADLDRLASGDAAALVLTIRQLLDALPTPLE